MEIISVVRRVDGNDIGVLQPGQFPRLIVQAHGHFQGNRPICQLPLLGAENFGKRTFPKLFYQLESKHAIAAVWHLLNSFIQVDPVGFRQLPKLTQRFDNSSTRLRWSGKVHPQLRLSTSVQNLSASVGRLRLVGVLPYCFGPLGNIDAKTISIFPRLNRFTCLDVLAIILVGQLLHQGGVTEQIGKFAAILAEALRSAVRPAHLHIDAEQFAGDTIEV